ncbi:MAG TPA: ABC transporter permease [Eubacteriaceae bacterium]|nr:ABC transporter permease [Eubacteriaceae bacterium]
MSFHIFKYSFKSMIKDNMALFWMLFFPIILATFFNLAFQNLTAGEGFERVNIAVATENKMPVGLEDAMEDSDLFQISYMTEDQAEKQLTENKITGYLTNRDGLEMVILDSGMNQSISKVFLDNYLQVSTTVHGIIEEDPRILQTDFLESINLRQGYLQETPVSNSMNPVVIYFYALMAMTCLFSAIAGCYSTALIQANQSPVAARINIAPTHKLRAFVSMTAATILFQMSSAMILIAYITQILKVDFGDRIIHIAALCLVGCFTGSMFGTLFGAVTKFKSDIKDMLISNIVVIMCFLSGLMVLQMKYIVQQHAPIISYINPASLITDGLYALYYYDTFERYFLNITLLAAWGLVYCALSILILRRQKYASI